jgi:hypothetical protein
MVVVEEDMAVDAEEDMAVDVVVDTVVDVVVDMEAVVVDMGMAEKGEKLMQSLKPTPLLSQMLAMDMVAMEDMAVDTAEDMVMEAMVVMVAMEVTATEVMGVMVMEDMDTMVKSFLSLYILPPFQPKSIKICERRVLNCVDEFLEYFY